MKKIYLSLQPLTNTVAIASVLLGCLIRPTNPQTLPSTSDTSFSILRPIYFKSPDLTDQVQPGYRRGTASHSRCGATQQSDALFALIPTTNLGLTVDPYPTFWFYIPHQPTHFHSVKFVLWSDKGEKVYETTNQATDTLPGVISLPLPSTALPLEPNQNYNWIFTLYCEDPQLASDPTDPKKVRVRGSIQRVTPTPELERDLKTALTQRDQAALYAQQGIWFNALTILGNLRRTDTRNPAIVADWTKLLADIDLSEISAKPIVECCHSPDLVK